MRNGQLPTDNERKDDCDWTITNDWRRTDVELTANGRLQMDGIQIPKDDGEQKTAEHEAAQRKDGPHQKADPEQIGLLGRAARKAFADGGEMRQGYHRQGGNRFEKIEQPDEDALERDMFLTAEAAKEFGVIDTVMEKRPEDIGELISAAKSS